MRDLLKQRSYLRALSPANRRKWFEQRKRLTPKVKIGTLYRDARQFAYVHLS